MLNRTITDHDNTVSDHPQVAYDHSSQCYHDTTECSAFHDDIELISIDTAHEQNMRPCSVCFPSSAQSQHLEQQREIMNLRVISVIDSPSMMSQSTDGGTKPKEILLSDFL